ncbi:GGDEF domain-containing protein [Jeotgalibaca arthritidis]|uniref:GGDEF domain-containing protein n=1 Tax=Jeotgalibaca arthritidis TaxID=1868794 RepID=A0A6G7K843_9LACT|nr:GGDEF domain-containing protein [Jeotgalibaca arthritidis]QII81439.1 GGDEF domain-containing protein [Jeotgalibaca arthritidis]
MLAISIANIAVLVTPFYLYYRIFNRSSRDANYSNKQQVIFVLIETLLGIILLEISFLFMGVEIDFRYILYSFSMMYLGWKITLPTMLLLSVYGFFFQDVTQPLSHLFMIFLVTFMMYQLIKIMERKNINEFLQLIILVSYNALIEIISILHTVEDIKDAFFFYLIVLVPTYITVSVVYLLMRDLRLMRERTDFDYLTRLLNVRKFRERLTDLEKNRETPISIAVLDIDWFKSYNDEYGHDAGDKILWGIAQVFNAYSTSKTSIYRIGGEEFGVIITDKSFHEAELVMADIMDNVVNRPIPINPDITVSITVSVGLVHVRPHESLNRSWIRADESMYHAKKNGRNQLYVGEEIA